MKEPPKMLDSFFKFDKLITPTMIKIVFYVGLALIVALSIYYIVDAFRTMNAAVGTGLMNFFITLAATPFALIMWRVVIELILVSFRNNERLTELAEKGKH